MTLPEHIAIIMDGNGRWAQKRKLPRPVGHKAGVDTVRKVTEFCARKGIKALTLFAFSTENWKRSPDEVKALLRLFEGNLRERAEELKKNNIRLRIIGRTDAFPQSLRDEIERAEAETSGSTGMTLSIALNYGGRQEIIDAARKLCGQAREGGADPGSLGEKEFEALLYTAGLPDPDLVIRTSGEMRISNFLLWQAAYAEFYTTDALWPDFDEAELDKALEEYAKRKRRFGG